MSKRQRLTWAADHRKASAPPATPGYETEDQDHPAHQGDPAYEEYKKGDPDAWAETPNPPPYPEGNPPADPGYDVEDQDHPAHEPNPRVPKESSLKAMVMRKAGICTRVARAMLGPRAPTAAVEDQALDLMDLPERELRATMGRLSGDFLSMDELYDDGLYDDPMMEDDLEIEEVFGQDEIEEVFGQDEIEEIEELDVGMDDPIMARLSALEAEIARLRQANQNDPDDETLGASGESEEKVKAEAEATTKGEAKAAFFDEMDTDGDGFLTTDDWKGSKSLFASIDTDGDGIVSRREVIVAFCGDEDMMVEDDMMDLSPEEAAYLAEVEEMVEEDEISACGRMASDDDDDADDDAEADDTDEDDDDGDGDEVEGGKKSAGCEKLPKGPMRDNCEKKSDEGDADKKAADEDDDDEEDSTKEAATFALVDDPMGLGGTLPSDDALLNEVFGSSDEDEDDEDDEDEDAVEGGKKASDDEDEDDGDEVEGGKKANRQVPQRPKAAKGPKSLGKQVRTASGSRGEMGELQDLWESAPDVSDVFGS